MKRIKHIIAATIVSALAFTSVQAQNFDTNRMNRDLRILENVLGEFFKTGALRSASGNLFIDSDNNRGVKGTYLPDFGVIFMVPRPNNFGRIVIRDGNIDADEKNKLNEVFSFYYGDGDESEGNEITEENIEARIKEFLRDYAATIGQLKDDEKVMVIYGASSNSQRNMAFTIASTKIQTKKDPIDEIPIISVVADKKDIEDYRSGKLSESAFNNKVSLSKTEKKEYLDLKVLSNIFETALEEGKGYEFHITTRGALSYLYMENFGALYTINVHLGHNRGEEREVIFGYPTGTSNIDIDKIREEQREREVERSEAVAKEYDQLLSKMREFIVDYARTLSTVKSDQHLLVTLNINDRLKDVPERVDFQIAKSVLEDLDKGKVNRSEAINKVTVREY